MNHAQAQVIRKRNGHPDLLEHSHRMQPDEVRLAGNVLAGTGSYLRIMSLFDGGSMSGTLASNAMTFTAQ